MNEQPGPITQRDLERELASMTEPNETGTELWREALQRARRLDARGTRRIPGRRLSMTRELRPAETAGILALVVILLAVPLLMPPSLGRARQSAQSVDEVPALRALPSEPPADGGAYALAGADEAAPIGVPLRALPGAEFADASEPIDERTMAARALPEAANALMARRGAEADAGRGVGGQADLAQPADRDTERAAERLIAVTTRVSVVVDDAEAAFRACEAMVDPAGGEFVENAALRGADERRTGELTLRVASERRDEVLDAVRALGEVIGETSSAEDLTAVIADAGARLRTLRQVEGELSGLLERRQNDDLEDIVAAQRELGRTRGEIESMEARLRSQTLRVRLSTIVVGVRERAEPEAETGPAYGRTAAEAGRDALTLVDRLLYLLIVSCPVWALAILIWLAWRLVRRLTRR